MTADLLVPTAERTLRIVELLLDHTDGLTPQDLLSQMDMSRSSLFLLLRTLKSLGYIEQSERRGRYRAGPRLEAWRSPSKITKDLLAAFYPEASHLDSAETLALVMRSERGPLLLGQVEGSKQVRSAFMPGQVYPELSAVQAVLAEMPETKVMENGYALMNDSECLNLALPVCRDGSHAEAALLLSAPSFRWKHEQLLETYLSDMRVMAARLSYHLGAPAYTPYRSQTETRISPTSPLSTVDIFTFLQGPWTARLACVRPDGSPHVIPVWQEWNDGCFYVAAWAGSQWSEYLLQNPIVSLTVDEPWPPLRRVVARGQAEPVEPGGAIDLGDLLRRMSHRYLGQTWQSNVIERAFCIRPDTLRGWQGLSGSAEV
jgi:DNA-binding IclR family transcriptional regulator